MIWARLKPLQRGLIGGEQMREEFDRNIAAQAGIVRPIDFSYSSRTYQLSDHVRTDTLLGHGQYWASNFVEAPCVRHRAKKVNPFGRVIADSYK